MTMEEKFRSGYQHIKEGKDTEAGRLYDQLIRELPDQPIGYIGKALSIMIRPGSCTFEELEKQILCARGLTCQPEYQDALVKLVNVQTGSIEGTLLMYMALGCYWEAVKFLLELGADIHLKTNTGATALWFVCRKELPTKRREDGRKIAKRLLELGAEVDVTNNGGVALLNSRTDPEIINMIRAAHPAQKLGGAPEAAPSEAGAAGNVVAWMLGIAGAAVGLVLGTVLDQFLAGFLWAAVLATLGALIGYQIDRIRNEGKSVAGKAIRNMVIFVAVLAVFGMLLGKCAVGEQKSYGYCPNCHTRIETKYIRNGSCWRCN